MKNKLKATTIYFAMVVVVMLIVSSINTNLIVPVIFLGWGLGIPVGRLINKTKGKFTRPEWIVMIGCILVAVTFIVACQIAPPSHQK